MAWFVGVLALLTAEDSELREVEGDSTLSLEPFCCDVVDFEMVSLDMPKSKPLKYEKSTEPEEGDVGAELPAFSRSARRQA